MKTKYFVYIVLAVGFIGLVSYRIWDNSKMNTQGSMVKEQAVFSVEGTVLVPEEFSEELSLTGTLEGDELIEIRSEVSGVVEEINFEEGAKVKKGQVLFRVNDSELRAQLAKMGSAEGLAEENERRAQLLLEKEAVSQEEYDFARAELRSAQAETQLIRAQLAKAGVRAAFSG